MNPDQPYEPDRMFHQTIDAKALHLLNLLTAEGWFLKDQKR